MERFCQQEIPQENLLLDPNNYRLQDTRTFVPAADGRFHESGVQARAYQRLIDDGIRDLKRSITQNGYIPLERLVVAPYPHSKPGTYLVIEGNRRLAAIRWILSDHEAGVDVDESVLSSIQRLPCVIVTVDDSDGAFRASLMGIRHVSSIKQWGGYQRSKLVAMMRDELELETSEVADRLGLSAIEVNRRYKAFKALQQMQENEQYGEFVEPELYPLFHEALASPDIRGWLGWDDSACTFTNEETIDRFYGLITLRTDEQGRQIPPKITTYDQVRSLKTILKSADAIAMLLDTGVSYTEALARATLGDSRRDWQRDIGRANDALANMGIQDLKSLQQTDLTLLQALADLIAERLADYKKMAGG